MSYIKNADIQGNAWVAPGACVVGNVTLGDESSVWYNAVIRGDMAPIVVGCGSNVQDGTVVHADAGFPCEIGNGTSIGHNAIIHGCTIGHNTVIGMVPKSVLTVSSEQEVLLHREPLFLMEC